ncbi:MAG: nitroreductase family protein [Candidatus Marinimicrobia bacterium]|nr:nitroreductase family protein [Candidatus Neomarinimicrobiota bacterium]
MTVKELVQKTRSYRRFYEDVLIERFTLEELTNFARLSASAKNLQPIRYWLSYTPHENEKIFPCLGWAGFLKDWVHPQKGDRPSGYIILLEDTSVNSRWISHDLGIAAQNILLGATEKELGGCIIAAINKHQMRTELNIPERYEIHLVLALGKPKETVVIDPVKLDGDTKYWRDDNDIHHVPKRRLEDIILN